MSWLDNLADPASIQNQTDALDVAPMPDKGPGFLEGALTAIDTGLTKGVLKVGDTLGQGLGQPRFGIDEAPSIDDFHKRKADARADYARIIKDLTPDPATTGLAGQVLNPLADVLPRAAVGAVAGGPIGSALLAGVPEYTTSKTLAESEGIDSSTASTKGIIDSTVMGVGAILPAARIFRGVVPDLAAAVGANVGLGVAGRGATSLLLEENGYTTQAAQYHAFDATAMAIDGVLGLGFFGLARLGSRGAVVTPEQLDAALVQNYVNTADMSGPGVPVDPASQNMHQSSLTQALDQINNNQPVQISGDMENVAFLRLPRGVRNNNPGNIRADGTPWQGMIPGTDRAFATFDSPESGIRALAKNLLTYQDKHGLNTVLGIIQRWAPATENNTQAYVSAVSKEMGVEPGDNLNLRDPETLNKLTKAIIKHENGRNPYRSGTIDKGVQSALRNTPIENAGNAARRQLASRTDMTPEMREGIATRFEQAATVKADFDSRIQQIIDGVSIKKTQVVPDELGSVDAIAQNFMDGNYAEPIIKSTVEVDNLDQVPQVMEQLQISFPDTVGILNYLSGDTHAVHSDGYRDTRVTVNVDGVPAEVQIVVPQMQAAQRAANRITDNAQVIERRIVREQREATPDEAEQIASAEPRRQELYRQAWDDATRQPETAREQAPPAVTEADATPAIDEPGFISRVMDSVVDLVTGRQADAPPATESPAQPAQAFSSLELESAAKAIEADPNLRVTLDDGREVSAAEALQIARDEVSQAQNDSKAYEAAVTCFLRTA